MVLSQLPIAYVDIRFYAHATEDMEKVVDAVHNVLPSENLEDITFNRSNLKGHYGNPITMFETRIKDKRTIEALVENLTSNLSSWDKEELGRMIQRYFEKGSLFLRFDKQAALQCKIKLAKSDPIHIRIRFRKSKLEEIIEVCQEIGMLT